MLIFWFKQHYENLVDKVCCTETAVPSDLQEEDCWSRFPLSSELWGFEISTCSWLLSETALDFTSLPSASLQVIITKLTTASYMIKLVGLPCLRAAK